MPCLKERDLARWGRDVRKWLAHDERRRTIGLVVLSVAISIAMSLVATAIVRCVSRRRAAARADAPSPDAGDPMAEVVLGPAEDVGVPVVDADALPSEDDPARATGAQPPGSAPTGPRNRRR
ncbi:MAG: hypothetical protein V2B17_04240 [Chloroflexota bacterium]